MKKDTRSDFVVSPFSDTNEPLIHMQRKGKMLLAIGFILLTILILSVTKGLYGIRKDPFRTLELFPAGKYLDGYKPLTGSRFRGELRVENDLGWKDGVGRLMTFSSQEDPRPIVVMLPPQLAEIYFAKGQTYVAELEVKEGGLIYANSCRKN